MSPEERFERIERKLDLVVGIQAQMVVAQQKQDAGLAKIAKVAAMNSKDIARLSKAVGDVVRITDEQGDRMERYFTRLDKRQNFLEERLRRTDERLRRSDKRFDAVISLLKRKSSNGRH